MKKLLQKWTQSSLILRIFCGLVLGAILGLLVPQWTGIGILGQVFVGALKAVAPVLVAVLVMSSIARAKGGLGPRFRTVIILYLLTTFIAALVAVSGSFLFPVTIDLKGGEAGELPGGLADIFAGLLNNMVANPVLSLTTANYMGILFWSVIIGVAIRITRSQTVITFMGELSNVVSLAVKWIIQFAPFGILGLVFSSVSEGGLEIFTDYGRLLLLLVGCMLVTSLIVNPLLATIFLRKNPYPLLWQCLKESGISAFFTRSSAANIPMNMALCKKLGLDEEFYSVSIPLGSTINMDGAAVTITVLTLAVANTLGMDVSFGSALLLSVLATLGACGASGVAGGSLLLVPMACSLYGIPQDIAMQAVAVGFVISVIQDSVETALNSSGDAFFTAVAELHDRRKQKK
ncbi:MAG: serine/threonine transporter SstT [Bacteroidales bacterium]|nr:serine/threonine transporter SstT [Bacteroidales bacterium]MBQ7072154.1 serine/threonine transporter SstT [Bacteroidales bacterium]MBR4000944.1 serine/threonine transporter SstT [Bacteroidales bacterium]